VSGFSKTAPAQQIELGVSGVDATVGFSPYASKNAMLKQIGDDMRTGTTSCLFYSLAFLGQTEGPVRDAITAVTEDDRIFVYGIADKKVDGINLQRPGSNLRPVRPEALGKAPEPFKSEPKGGGGNRMHHKFVVIDFDKPTARVYLGSYNFSGPADRSNGENLFVIRDQRIATSYMVEALRIFDHYHFRVLELDAKTKTKKLFLKKPPRAPREKPWWDKDYKVPHKIRDRELFA
jgi:phosphatidylserine/phosphatidylglycerophosphate/cardiolipin synthase-like enzyme